MKATMHFPDATPKRLLAAGLALLLLALCCWYFPRRRESGSFVPKHSFALQAGRPGEFRAIGGQWEFGDGFVMSKSYERGAKLVAGSSEWANYTLRSDIRFDAVAADMGLIVRSNDETEGTDAYNGYFVGLRSLDGTLVIGRANYGAWVEARPIPVPGGFSPYVWYRVQVTSYGCHIAASVQNLKTLQTSWLAFEERYCVKDGRIGLRSLNANGMWRNISVAPATWSDYLEMERHTQSIEQLVVFAGPPWWTPWHVGMLFVGVLAAALLAQLIYFRMQQWKALAITEERERLAHEIHDTMAQSFAGVGYQIQGIRRSVMRSRHKDSPIIAEQLNVAYQLVRKCHEEASRTISMFSASSPLTQQGLLDALEETARKLGGNQIEIITRLSGNSTSLALRLKDALLHIGQEAIANAVSHSDPTRLTINLGVEANSVALAVGDNGRGFVYRQETAGFGILGMQKRAHGVSGILQIDSTPGQGTVVCVVAPLEEENARKRSA
jgi:signal transduction histidine kinase